MPIRGHKGLLMPDTWGQRSNCAVPKTDTALPQQTFGPISGSPALPPSARSNFPQPPTHSLPELYSPPWGHLGPHLAAHPLAFLPGTALPPPQSRSSDPTRKQPTVKLSHISHSFLNNMNGSGKACDVWWVGRSVGVCASMQLPNHVSEFFSKLF